MKKATLLLALLLLPAVPASAAPPSNDDWQQAQEITSFPARVEVDLEGVTQGDHETSCPITTYPVEVTQPVAAVWYRFEAPEGESLLRYASPRFGPDVSLQLYRETTDILGRPMLERASSCHEYGEIWFYDGGTYLIAVDETNATDGALSIDFDLYAYDGPVPSNDVSYRATEVSTLPFETTQVTFNANTDIDPALCPGRYGSTWFAYEPAAAGTVRLSVEHPTGRDASVFAFEERTGRTLACVGTDGDSVPSSVAPTASVRAGERVLINIGGSGRLVFRIDIAEADDDFADRVPLPRDVRTAFTTAGATLETGEPAACGDGGSLWFEIDPGDVATLIISADGPTTAALFTGTGIGDLVQTACTSDSLLVVPASSTPRFLQIRGDGAGTLELRTAGNLGVQVTDASPFPGDCGDTTDGFYTNSEVEVSAAVDPSDPNHVVAAWQQDRHRDRGGARGVGTAVSTDGGATWTKTTLQGLSLCGGGEYRRMTDPWATIGADGAAYVMTLAYNADIVYPSTVHSNNVHGAGGAFVHRSTDGGITWEGPFTITTSPGIIFSDKNTITADPTDANRLYAAWSLSGDHVVARSDDGGRTWLPPISLPGGGTGDQVAVLDDGTVVEIGGNQSATSRDHGLTWSAPVTIGASNGSEGPPGIRAGNYIPSVASDGTTVYVSWVNRDHILVAFSDDAGASWNVRWIQTDPQERFTSAIAITDDGAIGVTSYQLDRSASDRPRLVLATSTDRGATWSERAVTTLFDLSRAPYSQGRGLFLGDYMALQDSGSDFVAVYTAVPDGTERYVSNVYAQRLTP